MIEKRQKYVWARTFSAEKVENDFRVRDGEHEDDGGNQITISPSKKVRFNLNKFSRRLFYILYVYCMIIEKNQIII